MRNHLFPMSSSDPAPQGGGDTRSWFYYYKIRPEEPELFVPIATRPELEAGDILWFILDENVVACSTVLRVIEDPMKGSYEIWYSGTGLIELDMINNEETRGVILNGDLWKKLREAVSSRADGGSPNGAGTT